MTTVIDTTTEKAESTKEAKRGKAIVPPNEVVMYLDGRKLRPSPTQPRNKTKPLGDLIDSVKEKGVLSPVLARKVDGLPEGEYELVYGHRRTLASVQAGRPVPTIIRILSDAEVLEIQMIENLQREDLDPLDEADGYMNLHDKFAYSVDTIATKIGKSRSYVFARLKLCTLVPAAREALAKGKLTASTALRVARIPPGLQESAVAELCAGEDAMSDRLVADIIQRRFMLRLNEAPFDKSDLTLVPDAGPCSKCPKRTGNQPDLFGDVKTKDTCTDPLCFEAKKEAAWAKASTSAQENGITVLADKEAKKVLVAGNALPSSGYIDLAAECPEDSKKRTYGELLGKKLEAGLPIAIARDASGVVHKLVPVEVATKLLPAKAQAAVEGDFKAKADRAKEKMYRDASKSAAPKLIGAFAEKVEEKDWSKQLLLVLIKNELLCDESSVVVSRRLGEDANVDKFKDAIERWPTSRLSGLLVELLLCRDAAYWPGPTKAKSTLIEQVGEALKVDVRGAVAEELKAIKVAKSEKRKPKAKAEDVANGEGNGEAAAE